MNPLLNIGQQIALPSGAVYMVNSFQVDASQPSGYSYSLGHANYPIGDLNISLTMDKTAVEALAVNPSDEATVAANNSDS